MTKTSSNQSALAARNDPVSSSSISPARTTQKTKHKEIIPPGKGLAKNQTEAAEYIVEMLVVLCNMAKDVDLKFLNYLLEMAYEESTNHVHKMPVAVKSPSK